MSFIALSPRTWNHKKYISYFITVSYINATDIKGRKGLSVIHQKQNV